MDGVVGSLSRGGRCQDKHVKVEEEPPKWGGVDGVGLRVGDGEDRVCLKTEDVGFVAFLEVTSTGGRR